MRATLHDELMHEAGFETDYYRELAARRERRRQKLRRDALRVLSVVAFVCALGAFGGWIVEVSGNSAHVPQALLAAAALATTVGGIAKWLAGRMASAEDGEEQPRRSILLRILAPSLTLANWVREQIARRREIEA